MKDPKYIIRKKLSKNIFIQTFIGPIYHAVRVKLDAIQRHSKMKIFQSLQNDKRIFFLGIPESNNLGDLAQQICTHRWFEKNYPDYQVVEFSQRTVMHPSTNFIELLKEHIKSDDYIFFESGGNIHDYPDSPPSPNSPTFLHQLIVKNIRNVPIIFLAETIKFWNPEEGLRIASVFNDNPNIFFIARDPVSQQIASQYFSNAYITCYPDIVTTLIGSSNYSNVERQGIVMCLRNDKEKFFSDCQLNKLSKHLEPIGPVTRFDTCLQADFSKIKGKEYKVIKDFVELLARAKVVVTDRFHGTIFSLIAGTPVVVLRSIDHKVVQGQNWLSKDYPNHIKNAKSLEEVIELVSHMYEENFSYHLNEFSAAKKYDVLKDEIEKWKLTLAQQC